MDALVNKDITLIQGDCLEIMKTIPDKSIDLVLTDRFILTNIHTGCRVVVKENY